jgi:hypothetical protein
MSNLIPTLTPNTKTAAKHPIRIHTLLDLKQTLIIRSKEPILPILLIIRLIVIRRRAKRLRHILDQHDRRRILRRSRPTPRAEVNNVNKRKRAAPRRVHGRSVRRHVPSRAASIVLPDKRN